MAATRLSERPSPVAFFEQQVAPVVFERLDELFPEFGFTRDQHGWRATQQRNHPRVLRRTRRTRRLPPERRLLRPRPRPRRVAQPSRKRRHAARARLRRRRPSPRPCGRRRHESSRPSRVASRAARLGRRCDPRGMVPALGRAPPPSRSRSGWPRLPRIPWHHGHPGDRGTRRCRAASDRGLAAPHARRPRSRRHQRLRSARGFAHTWPHRWRLAR